MERFAINMSGVRRGRMLDIANLQVRLKSLVDRPYRSRIIRLNNRC